MSCDIYAFAEVKGKNNKWEKVNDKIFPTYYGEKTDEPFSVRSYSLFGFLANVRNYAYCPVIAQPKGLPNDSEYLNSIGGENWVSDGGNASYLTLKELLEFDYEQVFENKRMAKQTSSNSWTGAHITTTDKGQKMTVKEHLEGSRFFQNLEVLKTLGEPEDVRVLFYFDDNY